MDPALPPSLLLPCTLVLPGARLVSWLIPSEMLAQASFPRLRDKMTLWPSLNRSASPSCPVPWFACLPTGLNHSSCAFHCPGARLQDFLGRLRGIKIAISHNLSKLLIQEYVFSLLRLHLAAQRMSTKIHSWYLLSFVNSLFPGALG